MIDKIIDIYERKNSNEIIDLKEEIIESNSARFMFVFAYYFPEYIDSAFNKKMIETNDVRYITFMFRQIKTIDDKLYFNKILEYDNKDIFYSLFDRRVNNVDYYLQVFDVYKNRNIDKYVFLTLYLFFIINDEYDLRMFEILKKYIPEVTKENYKEKLIDYIDKNKEDIPTVKEYTRNCYIGHNNYIPDYIVLHISFDYGRVIKAFYNKEREVSSHFVISRKGDVVNLVSLENSAWANGTSMSDTSDVYYRFSKNEEIRKRKDNANYYSYSIENESIDGSLTEEQYNALIITICKIIDYIKNTYGVEFKIDEEHIIGHRDVNPLVRVSCPGFNFPMKKIIEDVKKKYATHISK